MSTSATASGKHRKRKTADGRTRSEHGAPRTVGPQAPSRSCVRLFLTKGQSATPAPPANGTGRVTDARVRGGDCKGCCAPSVLPLPGPEPQPRRPSPHGTLTSEPPQALRAASTHGNSPTASRRPPCRHRPRASCGRPPPARPPGSAPAPSRLCPAWRPHGPAGTSRQTLPLLSKRLAATRPPRRRHEPLVTEGLHAALSPTRCPSLSKAALAPWPLLRHTGTLPLWGSTSASPSARPPGAAPAATSPRERPPR